MDQPDRPLSPGVATSEDAAKRALRAGGFTDDEIQAHLIRGNLQWFFFKRWAIVLLVAAVLAVLLGHLTIGLMTLGAGVVALLLVYILAGVWAAREYRRYEWVDDGGAFRRVLKKN